MYLFNKQKVRGKYLINSVRETKQNKKQLPAALRSSH